MKFVLSILIASLTIISGNAKIHVDLEAIPTQLVNELNNAVNLTKFFIKVNGFKAWSEIEIDTKINWKVIDEEVKIQIQGPRTAQVKFPIVTSNFNFNGTFKGNVWTGNTLSGKFNSYMNGSFIIDINALIISTKDEPLFSYSLREYQMPFVHNYVFDHPELSSPSDQNSLAHRIFELDIYFNFKNEIIERVRQILSKNDEFDF